MLRVLHSLDSLNRGGAETLELDVCRNAKACGLDLTFVATGGGDLEEEFRRSGVDFLRLQRRMPLDPALVMQLRRIIRERGIHVVHSQQPVEAFHLRCAARGLPTRQVLTIHGEYPGLKNQMALRFLLPRLDARIAVSDTLRQALLHQRSSPLDFITVHNAVDCKRLAGADGTRLRAELGLSRERILLGMVGNFYSGRPKDQLTICRSLPRVFERVPSAAFVFVGGRFDAAPELFDACVDFCHESGISNRVYFLGKRADVPDILAALDVFVLSSVREGAPVAAIEAMMMGIPAVFSDIEPLREVSGDGHSALLFRTGDAADLAEKLIAILSDRDERDRLAAKGQARALREYGVEKHIQNLLEIYRRLGA